MPTLKGADLAGTRYHQLLPYAQPEEGDAFRVVIGDFVSTEDGTGIVHIAPSFGADDFKTARENGIGALTLVDKKGKFLDCVTDFAGEYVKEAYLTEEEKAASMSSVPEPQKGSMNGLLLSHPDIRIRPAATTSFNGASPDDSR